MRRISARLSPPSFSTNASASTQATIASPTTEAAGTAHTSERWYWVSAARPVARSTERWGAIVVGIGFMAARATTGTSAGSRHQPPRTGASPDVCQSS